MSEFTEWLKENPEKWSEVPVVEISDEEIPVEEIATVITEPANLPQAYMSFLSEFGVIRLLDEYDFLTPEESAKQNAWISTLRDGEHSHLMPFLNLGFDCASMCFDGESVIDYDPYNGTNYVASSFDEFIMKFVNSGGDMYWIDVPDTPPTTI